MRRRPSGAGPSRIGAPSLLTGRARSYSDGYIYSIIRYGRGVMPRYGDTLSPEQVDALVKYLKEVAGQ